MYERTVTETKENFAKDVYENRLRVAQDIVSEAKKEPEHAKNTVESNIYKLDIPSVSETVEILMGKLKRPAVAQNAYVGLSFVDDEDIEGLQKELYDSVNSAAPLRKKDDPRNDGKVRLENMEPGAQELALDGADKFVYKKKQGWEPVKKLTRTNPVEYEKVEKTVA